MSTEKKLPKEESLEHHQKVCVPVIQQAMNIVAKWRNLFAMAQTGRLKKQGTPRQQAEFDAVADAREAIILLRIEVSALTNLLLHKLKVSQEDLDHAVATEAAAYHMMFAQRFPGWLTCSDGLVCTDEFEAAKTAAKFDFPMPVAPSGVKQ